MARYPKALKPIMGLYQAIAKESTIDPNLQELANLEVSRINRCRNCLAHHTQMAKTSGVKDEQLKALLKRKHSIKISTEKGEGLRAIYNKESDSVTVTDERGGRVKSFDVFWFAWYAFHPDTKVIE